MRHYTFQPGQPLPTSSSIDLLLDAEQLGRFLNLGTEEIGSARTALNVRIARGHPLPPCVEIPGVMGRRWLFSSVLRWVTEYERPTTRKRVQSKPDGQASESPQAPLKRRRGRPTKADSVAARTG